MIRVAVALSEEKVIGELVVEGHAGFGPKGLDIVCSAFTILLRTFVRTVEASTGVLWAVKEDGTDRFHLVMSGVSPDLTEQYRGWCEYLLRGLEDLARDEPRRVQIEYGSHSGRLFHGS